MAKRYHNFVRPIFSGLKCFFGGQLRPNSSETSLNLLRGNRQKGVMEIQPHFSENIAAVSKPARPLPYLVALKVKTLKSHNNCRLAKPRAPHDDALTTRRP